MLSGNGRQGEESSYDTVDTCGELEGSRIALGWLESAFGWLIDAGELLLASQVLQAIEGLGERRQDVSYRILQTAQKEQASVMLAAAEEGER